jgi:ketosteroid isomerase-like protein
MSDLDALLDKQAITEVCYRYGIIIDSRDWSRLATCFTPDAQAYYMDMPPCHGYQAIEDTCRQALSPLDGTQHLIANVTVDLDGDEADSFCYLQAQHVKTGTPGGDNFMIAGRYLDRFVRTGEGWRIRQRRLEGIWTDGNPAVIGG